MVWNQALMVLLVMQVVCLGDRPSWRSTSLPRPHWWRLLSRSHRCLWNCKLYHRNFDRFKECNVSVVEESHRSRKCASVLLDVGVRFEMRFAQTLVENVMSFSIRGLVSRHCVMDFQGGLSRCMWCCRSMNGIKMITQVDPTFLPEGFNTNTNWLWDLLLNVTWCVEIPSWLEIASWPGRGCHCLILGKLCLVHVHINFKPSFLYYCSMHKKCLFNCSRCQKLVSSPWSCKFDVTVSLHNRARLIC